MSLLDATQLTGWATLALAVLAATTAVFALAAARTQAQQVRILRDQVDSAQAELARQAEEGRRAQAARVFITRHVFPGRSSGAGTAEIARIGPKPAFVDVKLHNTSEQPIYDVHIHWVDSGSLVQAGSADEAGTLPPDREHRASRPVPTGVTIGNFTAAAYFRDSAGLRWTVTPGGGLREVRGDLKSGAGQIAVQAFTTEPDE